MNRAQPVDTSLPLFLPLLEGKEITYRLNEIVLATASVSGRETQRERERLDSTRPFLCNIFLINLNARLRQRNLFAGVA